MKSSLCCFNLIHLWLMNSTRSYQTYITLFESKKENRSMKQATTMLNLMMGKIPQTKLIKKCLFNFWSRSKSLPFCLFDVVNFFRLLIFLFAGFRMIVKHIWIIISNSHSISWNRIFPGWWKIHVFAKCSRNHDFQAFDCKIFSFRCVKSKLSIWKREIKCIKKNYSNSFLSIHAIIFTRWEFISQAKEDWSVYNSLFSSLNNKLNEMTKKEKTQVWSSAPGSDGLKKVNIDELQAWRSK